MFTRRLGPHLVGIPLFVLSVLRLEIKGTLGCLVGSIRYVCFPEENRRYGTTIFVSPQQEFPFVLRSRSCGPFQGCCPTGRR